LEIGILLLIASERFMLDRLKALCEDIIRRDVNDQNAIGILLASHQHNATGLKDIALEFILRNLNEPAVMLGLAELKSEPDLLVEIIQRNTSPAPSPSMRELAPAGGPFGSSADWATRR
jgi:speckle-type POZ protein